MKLRTIKILCIISIVIVVCIALSMLILVLLGRTDILKANFIWLAVPLGIYSIRDVDVVDLRGRRTTVVAARKFCAKPCRRDGRRY